MNKIKASAIGKMDLGKKFINTLVLLVVSIVAMAITFGVISYKTKYGQEYVELTSEQQVLSQRIAKYAFEAATGNKEAFNKLKEGRDRFQTNLNLLKNGNPDTGLPASEEEANKELSSVESKWVDFRGNIDSILNGQRSILAVGDNARTLNEVIPQVLADTDVVAKILVKKKAPAEQIYKASLQLMLGQRIANNVNQLLKGGEGSIAAAESFERDITTFSNVLIGMIKGDRKRNINQIRDPEALQKLEEISEYFSAVGDIVEVIMKESSAVFEVQEATSQIVSNSDQLIDSSTALKLLYSEQSETGELVFLVFIFGGFAMVLLATLGVRLVRDAAARTKEAEKQNMAHQQSILRLLDEIQGLSEGDLSSNAVVTEDFTGAIADAFNTAIEELRQLVTTINETSVQVSSAAQESQATAIHLAEASDHQAQQITAASLAVNEMAVSIEEVSKNASESAGVAQQAVEIASKGSKTVRRTIDGMDIIREQIQETSKRIKRLGESSQEIGDIVELINDIADQTNILSLNAAIQAAMAGEAGRGFAVVADEVQRLAERSGNATKQIEALVKTIQTDTNEAVISMEHSTSGVVDGARLAEDAGEALVEIENVSNRLAELIQSISGNANDQSVAAAHISDTMNVIKEITAQTSAGTNETAASIGNLADLANDLRKSVAGFKLPE